MAEIVPFDLTREPFVRIVADGDRFLVRAENCPRLRQREWHFAAGVEAVKHGMRMALENDLPMLLRPRLVAHIG